jgi:hypothetical protein
MIVPRSAGNVIPNHRIGAGNVTVNTPITVNVAGGAQGPAADRDLADRVSSQVRNVVRQLFTEELRTQMRPGGMLSVNS